MGATIFSDDRIVVRANAAGHLLCGTPWHGDLRRVTAQEAALHAVFFLEHADQTVVERISAGEAQRRMLTTVWQPVWTGQDGLASTWRHCTRLAREVPMFRLRFRPEAATIDELRRLVTELRRHSLEAPATGTPRS